MSAFLLPSRNSTARYWWLWNPELVARNGRIWAYSLGVSVASTSHCSTSCFCTCLTRASRFSAGRQLVGGEQRTGRVQLVQQQLHPQLGDLVLHDEEQLVVLHRLAARVLRRQQGVEVEVGAVRHRLREVGGDPLLQHALGPVDGRHPRSWGHCAPVSSGPSARTGSPRTSRPRCVPRPATTSIRPRSTTLDAARSPTALGPPAAGRLREVTRQATCGGPRGGLGGVEVEPAQHDPGGTPGARPAPARRRHPRLPP